MGTLHTFRPRPAAPVPPPSSPADVRAQIEEAAQAALDTADALLRILDRMDGDPDLKDGGDAEPSLAAPENHHGSQIVWLRGSDQDREAEAVGTVLPNVCISPAPRFRPDGPASAPLAWGGHGNIVAAAGIVLLDMVVRR